MTAYRKGSGPFEVDPPTRPMASVLLIELLSFLAVVAVATTVLVLSFFFYPQNSTRQRIPDRTVTPILTGPSEELAAPINPAVGTTTTPGFPGTDMGSASAELAGSGRTPKPAGPSAAATESNTAAERFLPEIEPASGGNGMRTEGTAVTPPLDAGGAAAEPVPVIEANLPPGSKVGEPDRAYIHEPPLSKPAAASPTVSVEPVSPKEMELLITRGDQLLGIGDVVAARQFYERAAGSANGAAAVGVGKTFDPVFLAQAGARGVRGDPAEAASWYRKASKAGNHEADRRLKILLERFPE